MYDVIVIGGGMIGSAIGYGLTRLGQSTLMLDEGDAALRAACGNFGLIWVQGKGAGCPAYARWTRLSTALWPAFNAELQALTHKATHFRQGGGIHLCLHESELNDRMQMLSRIDNDCGMHRQRTFEVMNAAETAVRLPGVGPDVAGGSYCALDGDVNPLHLLRAMHAAFLAGGGRRVSQPVRHVASVSGTFTATTTASTFNSRKIVVAAGLSSPQLGRDLGLHLPVRPQRGQILATERLPALLSLPTAHVRQSAEGTILLGDSHENVGRDDGTRTDVQCAIARRACRCFPTLSSAKVLRGWGALRTLTPDGFPIYAASETHPGAYGAVAHSGVTLAAVHALRLAPQIAQGTLELDQLTMSPGRFDVSAS